MGDTGSIALGAAMAGLALLTRTELLLIVLGGLYVTVTGSVVIRFWIIAGICAAAALGIFYSDWVGSLR